MNGELEKGVADEERRAAEPVARDESSETAESWQKTLAECDDAIRGLAAARDEARAELDAIHGLRTELEACRARIVELEAVRNDTLAQLRAAKADLAERDAKLSHLARARDAELALAKTAAATAATPFAGAERHLLFFQGADGYELVERAGPPPAPGEVVEVEGGARVVARVAAAPTPGPKLPCAYLAG